MCARSAREIFADLAHFLLWAHPPFTVRLTTRAVMPSEVVGIYVALLKYSTMHGRGSYLKVVRLEPAGYRAENFAITML